MKTHKTLTDIWLLPLIGMDSDRIHCRVFVTVIETQHLGGHAAF